MGDGRRVVRNEKGCARWWWWCCPQSCKTMMQVQAGGSSSSSSHHQHVLHSKPPHSLIFIIRWHNDPFPLSRQRYKALTLSNKTSQTFPTQSLNIPNHYLDIAYNFHSTVKTHSKPRHSPLFQTLRIIPSHI